MFEPNTFQTFLGVRHKEVNTSRQDRLGVTKKFIWTQDFENIGIEKDISKCQHARLYIKDIIF